MEQLHIISPAWNVSDNVQRMISAVVSSKVVFPFEYTVYSACIEDEQNRKLTKLAGEHHFKMAQLNDKTSAPNIQLTQILQHAQKKAMNAGVPLLVVWPEVLVAKDTIQELFEYGRMMERSGLISAIVRDAKGNIAQPHSFAMSYNRGIVPTHHNVGLFCALFTSRLLAIIDFTDLPDTKESFEAKISKRSRRLGFKNYMITTSSVEWTPKRGRYTLLQEDMNWLKYQWFKLVKRFRKSHK
ncbi:MAG: hypothetical protein LBS25_01770 [Candidatus Symbiothrix sp.]|jgi:hypothetical protein|nr:hypothetical protein [Candidatus Symbiothrix sp.]